MGPARKVYDWACQKTASRFSPLWLSVIFILESVLFLPMDAVLMLFCIQNPERRHIYALVATLTSLFVGILGYLAGLWLWDLIGPFLLQHCISQDFFNRLVAHYNQYDSLAVFMGGLLPIPFKAVTVSAGFCKLSMGSYIGALLLARGLRFFLVAESMHRWGDKIKAFIDRHFNSILVALGLKVVGTFAFFWILGH